MIHSLIAVLLCATPAAASPAGDAHAAQLAAAEPRVRKQREALLAEARKITDARLRRDALQAVEAPAFPGLEARRASEGDIVRALRTEGLLDEKTSEIFPKEPPMPFAAASAGIRHHSYPGGLIDHTLFNLRSGVLLARNYAKTFGVRLDEDLIAAAAVRHDAAKTWTVRWADDGAQIDEVQIAGTGGHHVLGVAEMLAEGWPPRAIVTLASAHAPPTPGADLNALLGYLRAAAIVSGKSYADAGLTMDGKALAERAPLEAFVAHLDDHDHVLSMTTAAQASPTSGDAWARNAQLAREPDIVAYQRAAGGAR